MTEITWEFFFFVSLTLLVIDTTYDPLVEYYLRQLVVIECKRRKKFTFDWWKVVVIERNDLQSYRNASNMLTTNWEIGVSWIASISPQTKEERIEEVTNDNNDDNITIEHRWWWRWYCENYKRKFFSSNIRAWRQSPVNHIATPEISPLSWWFVSTVASSW